MMRAMDKRKSVINISVSVSFRIAAILLAILVKRTLIQSCGNDVNGLNALYISVIGFLSVAEIGVGSAITFCLYKPIVNGDTDQIAALYQLLQKFYRYVGAVVFLIGLIIMPFLPYFAKDYAQLDVNLYLSFALILISSAITYFYSAKQALFNAYKNDYITTTITSGGLILQYVLQIVVLSITQSFYYYLVCRIVAASLQWIATDCFANKYHAPLLKSTAKVDDFTKKEVIKNTKAMFLHKIGLLLVNTVDNIVISAFVGVAALGEYTNYATVMVALTGIMGLCFTSLTSILGHFYAKEDKNKIRECCERMHFISFLMGTVLLMGYFAIADNLIALLFSDKLIISRSITFVLTTRGFVQFMRESALVFRDATGTFYNDRWKPILEGVVNIVLSIWLVKIIGVTGVIVATIITNLLISHIVEPYVLYKNAFEASPVKYYIRNYVMIIAFVIAAMLMEHYMNVWLDGGGGLFVRGFVSVLFSTACCILIAVLNYGPRVLKMLWKKECI